METSSQTATFDITLIEGLYRNRIMEVNHMLSIPELAMPKSNTVTTVYNGIREIWTDYEQAKAYYLELMMTTDGEERDRAECVYIQLLHGLDECSDE